jgi:hypothetical protein
LHIKSRYVCLVKNLKVRIRSSGDIPGFLWLQHTGFVFSKDNGCSENVVLERVPEISRVTQGILKKGVFFLG